MPNAGTTVVAKRLREARERLGLSQKALGVAAGIDEFSASPRINQYERGKHTPDLLTLRKLAEVLTVPVPYFFAEDDRLADMLQLLHLLPRSEWVQVKNYLARKVKM
jgi:transcriptional regulator with XRE-family HTH domain